MQLVIPALISTKLAKSATTLVATYAQNDRIMRKFFVDHDTAQISVHADAVLELALCSFNLPHLVPRGDRLFENQTWNRQSVKTTPDSISGGCVVNSERFAPLRQERACALEDGV